jgi:hypothetical protein
MDGENRFGRENGSGGVEGRDATTATVLGVTLVFNPELGAGSCYGLSVWARLYAATEHPAERCVAA